MVTKKRKILIIEDDRGLNQGIVMALKKEDYEFIQCYSIWEARKILEEVKWDLILLDINLPDGNGFDLLRKIKEKSSFPVIIITANDMEIDEVMGLELGADDYITKPFSLMVLRARIEKTIRLHDERLFRASCYEQGDMTFDFSNMQYLVKGKEIELSKTEQRLLKILVENQNIIMQRTALVDKVWTDGAEFVDENALSVTIKRLRDKIEENPSKPEHIQTVYGIGYVWR